MGFLEIAHRAPILAVTRELRRQAKLDPDPLFTQTLERITTDFETKVFPNLTKSEFTVSIPKAVLTHFVTAFLPQTLSPDIAEQLNNIFTYQPGQADLTLPTTIPQLSLRLHPESGIIWYTKIDFFNTPQ
jgi:hypothetical protein